MMRKEKDIAGCQKQTFPFMMHPNCVRDEFESKVQVLRILAKALTVAT